MYFILKCDRCGSPAIFPSPWRGAACSSRGSLDIQVGTRFRTPFRASSAAFPNRFPDRAEARPYLPVSTAKEAKINTAGSRRKERSVLQSEQPGRALYSEYRKHPPGREVD